MTRMPKFIFFVLSVFTIGAGAGFISKTLDFVDHAGAGLPAAGLIYQGNVLTSSEAQQLQQEQQIDLSQLDPQDDVFWSQSLSHSKEQQTPTPSSHFPSMDDPQGLKVLATQPKQDFLSSNDLFLRFRAQDSKGRYFQVGVSRITPTIMLNYGLMRQLGYRVPLHKYYPRMKLQFSSATHMENFLSYVQQKQGLDLSKWTQKISEDTVIVSGLFVTEIPEYKMGLTEGQVPTALTEDGRQALVPLQILRSYRALVAVLSLVYIPESVNRFQPEMMSNRFGYLSLSHPMADSFRTTTYEDVRWIFRRILQLSPQQWKIIFTEAPFPEEIQEIISRVIPWRIAGAAQLLDLQKFSPSKLPSLDWTSADGGVQQGRVTKAAWNGFPFIYKHEEVESLFQTENILRFIGIETQNQALQFLSDRLVQELQYGTPTTVIHQQAQDWQKAIETHVQEHPDQPLYKRVAHFEGNIGGLLGSVSRRLSTGAYYGSDAPLQLVDQMSYGISLGKFLSWDGITQYFPSIRADMYLVREYVHVRAVASVEQAWDTKLSSVWIPGWIKEVSQALPRDAQQVLDGVPSSQQGLSGLLKEMKNGDTLIITDSVGMGGAWQITSSLEQLLQLEPQKQLKSLNFSMQVSKVSLGQISLIRTEKGFQVYSRSISSGQLGTQFTANYYIDLIQNLWNRQDQDVKTRVYFCEFQDWSSSKDKNLQICEKGIQQVLMDQSDFWLNQNLPKYRLQHQVVKNETTWRIPLLSFLNQTQHHEMRLDFPEPSSFQEDHVQLVRDEVGSLVGFEPLRFIYDVVNAFLKTPYFRLQFTSSPNPAWTPWGRSHWGWMSMASEKNPKSSLPSTWSISEVYSGWQESHDGFIRVLEKLRKKYADLYPEKLRQQWLLPENFRTTQRLEFYKITASTMVKPSGFSKLQRLLSMDLPELYKTITTADPEYIQRCLNRHQNPNESSVPSSYLYNWKPYPCLHSDMRQLFVAVEEWKKASSSDIVQRNEIYLQAAKALIEVMGDIGFQKFLGSQNLIFFVNVQGFRQGDEERKSTAFSFPLGQRDPDFQKYEGLFQLLAKKTKISTTEILQGQGGF